MIVNLENALTKVKALCHDALKVLVISSCTNQKRRLPRGTREPSMRDLQSPEATKQLEALRPHRHAAESLYTGAQHAKLMEGIRAFRDSGNGHLDLRIVSAGFGVLRSDQKVPPYNAT